MPHPGHQNRSVNRSLIDAVKLDCPVEGGARQDFAYYVVKTSDAVKTRDGEDKRSACRQRTRLRSGKVLDPRNALLTECQIYDRSVNGARIRLIGDTPLPRNVRLYEDSPERLIEANVVWRKDREIGLSFNLSARPRRISRAQLAYLRGRFYAAGR